MASVQYIAKKRARFTAMCGQVNIPWGTPVYLNGEFLEDSDGALLCAVTSKNAHEFFARNDDGDGAERGALTSSIAKALEKRDKEHQRRWDAIWADPLCQKYRRVEHEDFWVWNHAFYEAPVTDLRHIAMLAGAGRQQ